MPIVEVTLLEGRSRELKAQLISELTDTLERVLGAPRPSIRVLLREVPPENWGVAGVPKAGLPSSGAPPSHSSKGPSPTARPPSDAAEWPPTAA